MKRVKRLLVVLTALLALLCVPVVARAADGDGGSAGSEYTYTVRFYAGAKGSFEGQTEFTGLKPGDRVTFDRDSVKLSDSKYYVMGIREAGKDNSTVSDTSFVVTEDADYVVAYGIKGEQVEYTVNFVDGSGNPLAESQTHYGNVGDTPVVAYQWVDDYEPNYYNITKTLSADPADNVFTFTYSPIETGTTGTTTIEYVDLGTTTVAAPAAAAPAAAAAAAPAAEAAAPAAAAAAPAAAAVAPAATPAAGAAAGGETIGGNATPTAGPGTTTGTGTGTGNGTETIPSEGGPTAGPGATTTATQGVPMPMLVIGALAVIGAIAAIATRLTNRESEE